MLYEPLTLLLSSQFAPLLAAVNLWYALPLIVSVSLVCAATRHEEIGIILGHAVRFGLWIIAFMGGVMAVLKLLDILS
ncbi:MAG: hypothetical protein MK171_00310 [Pirellulales bacterium]|nr:hypothetical protein [Pirellulales bacterium]